MDLPKSRASHASANEHDQQKGLGLRVISIAAPLLLILVGILHVFGRDKFTLDWPTTTLLITGVALLMLPLREIAANLLKLKVGGVEFEFRKDTDALSQKVAKAEVDNQLSVSNKAIAAQTEDKAAENGPQSKVLDHTEAKPKETDAKVDPWNNRSRFFRLDFDEMTALRYEVDQLGTVSPKAGLVRLAAAVEQDIIRMATAIKPPEMEQVTSFSFALDMLNKAQRLSQPLIEALAQFWKLRNRIVNKSSSVEDTLVSSAIDDGFRLLYFLESRKRLCRRKSQHRNARSHNSGLGFRLACVHGPKTMLAAPKRRWLVSLGEWMGGPSLANAFQR